MNPLSDAQLNDALLNLPAWTLDTARGSLYRKLSFTTFSEALAAMIRIGIEAEKADHHPEWTNVYGTLEIWLVTHDAGGITARDLALAHSIDGVFPEIA